MSLKAMLLAGMAVAVGAVFAVAQAVAGDATMTRIEPRPFYGAVITVEEGVRVFRPLPRVGHVIINPDHRTPLNLTLENRRVVSHNYHHYSANGEGGSGAGYAGSVGGLPYGLGGGEGRSGARGLHKGGGGIGVHGFRGYRSAKGHARGHDPRGHSGRRGGKGH